MHLSKNLEWISASSVTNLQLMTFRRLKRLFSKFEKFILYPTFKVIQNYFRNIIKKPTEFKTDILSVQEFYACPNKTVLPGAIYPDDNIRVKRLKHLEENIISIEPCCGTHVNSTSELRSFCITGFKMTKESSFNITAHCGEIAESVGLQFYIFSKIL